MKPWREVAIPNPDVLESKFLQSEFAADITEVSSGTAAKDYQDASAFFKRTFITEGMRQLLIQVGQRLNSKGGEPVIQLQTGFGGGKTHTMLAVYHLATRKGELSALAGISEVLTQGGLINVPKAVVAVLDGHAHSPGQTWQHGAQAIHTLWGELAWQLAGQQGYALVKESDETGMSPGKNILKTLLEKSAPCVVLIDELVAYVRQFPEGKTLSGGSYDSNLSFIQALTEAVKGVPNAILLASLPESDLEAGSQRGIAALRSLENTFVRVQAIWKPVATEEAFEIVRRRLFEPIHDEKQRMAACKAFADLYIAEGSKLPAETQEARYFERLMQAYPIHPEVFDRLFEDWTTIDGFQRTRGVLKLMAKVIHRLWKDDNKDVMILPGSLPLYDGNSRNELIYYLPTGWDAVMERDVDGDRSETAELENKEPRFGSINAARRVARTIFLGSAPSSVVNSARTRGLGRERVLLGCLQPGQTSSTYSDALNRLSDLCHYLNSSGDKTKEGTHFWFDVRANLRREMEQRKQRFDKSEVRKTMSETLKKIVAGGSLFSGIHPFTPHADVPDDNALRLVILDPEHWHTRDETRLSSEEVISFVENNGAKLRYRGNRLIFLAADCDSLERLRDCILIALAWNSIVEDEAAARLVLDTMRIQQAKRELQSANEVLPRVARECFKWLLCPVQNSASDTKITVEAFQLNTSGSSTSSEIERICVENELVISVWSPIHLRNKLTELYWKSDRSAILAMSFWDDTIKYLYLPRFKNIDVLSQAIVKGCGSLDFFGTAYGVHNDKFEGFKLGDANVQLDDSLLLIEPEVAKKYASELEAAKEIKAENASTVQSTAQARPGASNETTPLRSLTEQNITSTSTAQKLKTFHASVPVSAATAKVRMVQLAEEIIARLAADPQAELNVTVEINAEYPSGVSDQIRRVVSENAASLDFTGIWE